MKKLCLSICFTLFLGFHLSSLDVLAQSCSQLSLPENAIARLCSNAGVAVDLDYSPDGKTLVSKIAWSTQVVLWDIENKTEKLTINGVNGHSVRYSPDGKTLVCGDVVYDATTGEPKLLLLDGEGYHHYADFSPDGDTVAGAGPKGIRFWKSNVEESATDALPVGERPINVLPTDTSAINTHGESPTSIPFATSSTTVPGIGGLSYSPDGKELAIVCSLGIWIYNPELNEEVTLLNADIRSVAYSPDGKTLAGAWGGIRLWDAKTRKHKFRMPNGTIHGRYVPTVHSLAFSPDGEILISGDGQGGQIDFWDPANGEYKYTLPGSQHPIYSAIFSPDGNTIAGASNDSTILLWDFTSYPIISISPNSVTSLPIGDELAFDVKITNGKNVSGYQATIEFDPDALEYIETKYGDYLSEGVPVQPIANQRAGTVQLASLSLPGHESSGDGVLATIKFKVSAIRTSKIGLRDVILSNNEGNKFYAWLEGAQLLKNIITEDGESITCSTNISEDVNKDCVVNIQDLVLVATKFGHREDIEEDVNQDNIVNIIDLVLVAAAFGDVAAAPTVFAQMLLADNLQQWIRAAQNTNRTDATFQRGLANLQKFFSALMPEKTALLPNYPNPFNPETWIPYQLVEPAEITLSIYSVDGILIRTLALGHQPAGVYRNRDRAAYWDGTNEVGERVASGVYFYTLLAGDFKATRKMLVIK